MTALIVAAAAQRRVSGTVRGHVAAYSGARRRVIADPLTMPAGPTRIASGVTFAERTLVEQDAPRALHLAQDPARLRRDRPIEAVETI